MKTVKQFSIPFAGLKIGKHNFRYEIDDAFFSRFEYSLIKHGALQVELEFDKQQEVMFILQFRINGSVDLICERCLDPYQFTVSIAERLIVKIGDESFDDPEILVIPKSEHEIDSAPLIYEFISLALPLIYQHPADEEGEPVCNNETARVLKELQNNKEIETDTDPRWDILNKLKNN